MILSIVVLNMAKYTIISLILTDFVPIFFHIQIVSKEILGGHSALKKSQVGFFLGGVNPFQKSPDPTRGGCYLHCGPSPKFPRLLVWKA